MEITSTKSKFRLHINATNDDEALQLEDLMRQGDNIEVVSTSSDRGKVGIRCITLALAGTPGLMGIEKTI